MTNKLRHAYTFQGRLEFSGRQISAWKMTYARKRPVEDALADEMASWLSDLGFEVDVTVTPVPATKTDEV